MTAAFTDRIAVTHLGPFGLVIIFADAVRLLAKENVIQKRANRPAYDLSPVVIVFSGLLGLAVIPMGNVVQLADPEVGLVFAFAVVGITSIGYAPCLLHASDLHIQK